MEDLGFTLDSKEELDKKGSSIASLESDDYIIKIAKVDLIKKPSYVNGGWDYSKMNWTYACIVMVYGLKAGGIMIDAEGREVAPYSRYLFRDINPMSTGFMPDQVTPSFLRGIIAYMEGSKINDRLKAPNFILLDTDDNIITNEAKRDEFLQKITKGEVVEGYKGMPDIRSYAGRYIGCAIETQVKNGKSYNKISKFSRLPADFAIVDKSLEATATEKFNKYYTERILPKREEGGATSSATGTEVGEVEIEDIIL